MSSPKRFRSTETLRSKLFVILTGIVRISPHVATAGRDISTENGSMEEKVSESEDPSMPRDETALARTRKLVIESLSANDARTMPSESVRRVAVQYTVGVKSERTPRSQS
eukprot:162932_1